MADELTVKNPPARDFAQFRKAVNDIVMEVTTERRSKNANPARMSSIAKYDEETIQRYIEEGNIERLREISRYFFYRSGFYKRTLLYFGTMMLYQYYVTPNINPLKSGNNKKVMKKYYQALSYANAYSFDSTMPQIVTKLLVDGAYFALINQLSETEISFRDLPPEYCRTINKDGHGINILEFDVSYFDKISDEKQRIAMLKSFPKTIQKQYNQYKSKGQDFQWALVMPNEGVAFVVHDHRPPFISMIPAIVNLEDYRGMDKELDEMDLHRLVVQKMPITKEGELVFTLEETREIHKATAEMLKGVKHIDVLTTFADVITPPLKDSRQIVNDNLEKVEKSIYGEAGVSKEIFSPTRNLALALSIQNDLSYVLSIIKPIQLWFQTLLRMSFDDNSVSFDFDFLPVTYYNQKDMTTMLLAQANAGYSKILPSIAAGVKQHQVMSLAVFENEYLDIVHQLVPLQSAHTVKADQIHDPGAPKKDDTQRQQKTDDNKESGNAGGVDS